MEKDQAGVIIPDMAEKPVVQKIVLAGVVIENAKALILQRSQDEDVFPGMWELPSGKKEPLEDPLEALVREVFEETSLQAVPIAPVSIFGYIIEKETEICDTVQINFLMHVDDASCLRVSAEHQNAVWVSLDELDSYEMSKDTKQAICEAVARGSRTEYAGTCAA